jgi:thiamine-monophosphate kinase
MMGRLFKTEDEFVNWLKRRRQAKTPGLRLGIGDDAGLIEPSPGHEIILTADLSIEGVHFSRRLHPADAVGHRALARSLSDVAAMGGKPRFALISLALSKRADRAWVEEFYRGMFRLARRFGVTILGGDAAVTGSVLAADVTMLGEVARGRALLRSGARPGDAIYVAGTLGLSALGLRLLRSRSNVRNSRALRAHLYPEPQCALGQFLSERRLASAAIDLSDGLSLDLSRLLKASGAGAQLWESHIPRPAVAAGQRASAALSLALDGGEDYKLLFTVPASKASRLPASYQGILLHEIGEVRNRGMMIAGPNGIRPLVRAGYDHFR